jgi:hypothetical protein
MAPAWPRSGPLVEVPAPRGQAQGCPAPAARQATRVPYRAAAGDPHARTQLRMVMTSARASDATRLRGTAGEVTGGTHRVPPSAGAGHSEHVTWPWRARPAKTAMGTEADKRS